MFVFLRMNFSSNERRGQARGLLFLFSYLVIITPRRFSGLRPHAFCSHFPSHQRRSFFNYFGVVPHYIFHYALKWLSIFVNVATSSFGPSFTRKSGPLFLSDVTSTVFRTSGGRFAGAAIIFRNLIIRLSVPGSFLGVFYS